MTESSPVVWHGTPEERVALTSAVAKSCACTFTETGLLRTVCASHVALVGDQHWMDRLLYVRRRLRDYVSAEVRP